MYLGDINEAQTKADEALFCDTEALEIYKIHYGEVHLSIAKCLSLIGGLHSIINGLPTAIENLKKSVNIYNIHVFQNSYQRVI